MKDSTVHLALIILFVVIIRWAISLHPYSGAEKPPMYGDYEAQRHWMEITYNLPAEDWYRNTTDNDLLYWGLDYPPLTAYHSWIMGSLAHHLNSSWVELNKSRGHESYDHKLFMRYTVLAVDVLIYIPAVFVYFMRCTCIADRTNQLLFSTIVLLYPGLMLIDYGHFQYNCLSLGLALWGVIGLVKGHDLLGSIAFVLALNYKQMELYHAAPFFCYLFGSCVHLYRKKGLKSGCSKLAKLAVVVLVTFYICWHPFLHSWEVFSQVVHRLFPFARGLFEDKVANVWCSLSLLIKFKEIFNISSMVKICLSTTLLFLVPSALDLIVKPSISKFKYSLVNASLVFFLFSFQVHEKSILLAAIPVCLLLPNHLFVCLWFLLVSTFSMLPLLVKDGLFVAYLASMILFFVLADILMGDEVQSAIKSTKTDGQQTTQTNEFSIFSVPRLLLILFVASAVGMVIMTCLFLGLQPPKRFPDLFSVAISSYSCIHFVAFLIYFHWRQFTALPDISSAPPPPSSTAVKPKVLNEGVRNKRRKMKSS